MCNTNQDETVFHFVAVCPILRNIRRFWLKKFYLAKNEFYDLLNGKDWRALGNYLIDAWEKRRYLISQFNY